MKDILGFCDKNEIKNVYCVCKKKNRGSQIPFRILVTFESEVKPCSTNCKVSRPICVPSGT